MALLIAALGLNARSAEFHVALKGNDGNPGSPGHPPTTKSMTHLPRPSFACANHAMKIALAATALMTVTFAVPAAEPAAVPLAVTAAEIAPGVVGDGVHDDTAGAQALLDSGAAEVRFPVPPKCLLIGKPLMIHSGQTLIAVSNTVIRLKPRSDCLMITNDDHEKGNENITLSGGVWDMNNLNQSLPDYLKTAPAKRRDLLRSRPYSPTTYDGILLRFNHVKNLTIRDLTMKDPVMWGMQLGRLEHYTIENITLDYNLKTLNEDGIDIQGPARQGRISNIRGTPNDDMVCIAADNLGYYEMSRGPVEDLVIDGLHAANCWNAVRLNAQGNPMRRVHIKNITGTFRHGQLLTISHYTAHPGSPSRFEDIAISGISAAKCGKASSHPGGTGMIWVNAGCVIDSLTVSDFTRDERTQPLPTISVDKGATVESLRLSNITVINRTSGPLDLLRNAGTIGSLTISNASLEVEGNAPRGMIIRNYGQIRQSSHSSNVAVNATPVASEP
jgi:hypothetical protein